MSDFSPQLQEAIDFCGGLSTLTDGLCPPQDPADESALKRQFLPAKNIKVCKSKWVQIIRSLKIRLALTPHPNVWYPSSPAWRGQNVFYIFPG